MMQRRINEQRPRLAGFAGFVKNADSGYPHGFAAIERKYNDPIAG
jgi:hypothetical protein